MAQVSLDNVSKVFPGNVAAVRDFSLAVGDEEFVVLVGPSGCGKSTTLRMVAGLEELSAGTISIGGRVVNDVSPRDRDIAMVFQNYALYPHMTVYKNMAFALKLRGLPRKEIEERVRQTARILGIEDLLSRKPKALSGGERQRVAVGRAIVRQPAAFLFDEPLSNLDARLRLEMRAELKRLHQRLRRTVLYVTHDQEEAMTLGDRIVVMQGGRIQQVGKPLEVYGQPANRFVASFVGTPPMNFFDGRLVREDGICFDSGAFRLRLPDGQAGQLARWLEQPVVLGIRPEAMSLEPAGRFAGGGNIIGGRVQVVEPLGEKMDIFINAGADRRAVARVDARDNLRAGDELHLYVDPRRLHIFQIGPDGPNLLAN